jgi:hypothetical protein
MADALEIRASALASQGQGRTVSGYCAVFNDPVPICDFEEVIAPTAFDRVLDGDGDVLALYDHETGQLLGRRSAGTLRLAKDDRGLRFELDLPETQLGRDVAELVRRRDLAGCSFGFVCRSEAWQGQRRTLKDVDLREISIVAQPAYPQTSVAVRSRQTAKKEAFRVWTL